MRSETALVWGDRLRRHWSGLGARLGGVRLSTLRFLFLPIPLFRFFLPCFSSYRIYRPTSYSPSSSALAPVLAMLASGHSTVTCTVTLLTSFTISLLILSSILSILAPLWYLLTCNSFLFLL